MSATRITPRAIVSSGLCIGCGGCASREPSARMDWDRDGHLKPRGDRGWYEGGEPALAQTCPFSPEAPDETAIAATLYPGARHADPLIGRYDAAYVGHVSEAGFRVRGSSGGMVTWIAAELLRRGLVDGVAHVVPVDRSKTGRLFEYQISRNVEKLKRGAKSRYYPVEMSQILRTIRETPGRYAVVGIPCFIKAVNLLRRQEPVLRERIAFTIGLFCGHMKSAHMVDSFAWQLGAEPDEVTSVDYRLKNPERPANWYTAQLTLADGSTRQQDWWNLVDGDWGSGFFMNSACGFCDDVVAETADIAMGDAWLEPYSSDGNGTNVVIVRSPVMREIIADGIAQANLSLAEVGQEFVRQTQAAGFRQRREGLAYRLALADLPLTPRKRVAPSHDLPRRRKLIYRSRALISKWSHRVFRLAQRWQRPRLWIAWGQAALKTYHGIAYSRGRLGRWLDRYVEPAGEG